MRRREEPGRNAVIGKETGSCKLTRCERDSFSNAATDNKSSSPTPPLSIPPFPPPRPPRPQSAINELLAIRALRAGGEGPVEEGRWEREGCSGKVEIEGEGGSGGREETGGGGNEHHDEDQQA